MSFNGKNKAFTFSYDDGVTQDIRLIEILDKYGLKCTFNLNSELLGKPGELIREGVRVDHIKVKPEDVKKLYANHEVAVHTLTHPTLTTLEDSSEIIRQVEEDCKNLSALWGRPVKGMAYPGGGVNADERVADIIRRSTSMKYARTTVCTHSFDLQEDLMLFKPTAWHKDWDILFDLAEKFIALDAKEPALFYVWGHSYEFDIDNSWDKFEEFCRLISGKNDIFYGTNSEVFCF